MHLRSLGQREINRLDFNLCPSQWLGLFTCAQKTTADLADKSPTAEIAKIGRKERSAGISAHSAEVSLGAQREFFAGLMPYWGMELDPDDHHFSGFDQGCGCLSLL